jgi:phosphoesterase RecJ-like protein
MVDLESLRNALVDLLDRHTRVTILSHIHPDADAIGSSLGIYHWLREQGMRVEIANATAEIPHYLDFLPGFNKIKTHLDFDDALIIACDSGSIDRLGFDLDGRTIVNIDHHPTNTHYGTLNCVDPDAVASAQLAYALIAPIAPISSQSAVAFYSALVSDTRHFTTANMRQEVFALAQELVAHGVQIADVTRHMLHRRSLASLRILGAAIASLELLRNGRFAIMSLTQADLQRWGAHANDLDGIVDYARSLVTVEVAALLVERPSQIKVSLRSKGIDVARIAQLFGGGGHRTAAGYEVQEASIETVRARLLEQIDTMEASG